MDLSRGLAFVDVETTGLRPHTDRIAEVAVVTQDGDRIERWSSVVDACRGGHAPSSWRNGACEWSHAPRFDAIASEVAGRLAGRLVIAHNARFDLAFLQVGLAAAGIAFVPRIVCSLMLSRRLSPWLRRHDLDTLAAAHGLAVTVRHRALADAELLCAWWRDVVLRMPEPIVAQALRTLLAGPLLPAGLDPAIVDALPECPGAFTMLDERGEPLHTGAAGNLRAHAVEYFRVGHATGRALAVAHRVHRIAVQPTRGVLAARLVALAAAHGRQPREESMTWRFDPAHVPCVTLAPCDGGEGFGCFASARQARGALLRIARHHDLCRHLLGVDGAGIDAAAACADAATVDSTAEACTAAPSNAHARRVARARALVHVQAALRALRIEAWPYAGPIGLREGGDLIVTDRWRFLGIARDEADAAQLVATRPPPFDPRTYRLLRRALRRMPPSRCMPLHATRSAHVAGG